MKDFLENYAYAVKIAKIAIIFQTIMTVLICGTLLLMAKTGSGSKSFLLFCLYTDIAFVLLHLSYRRLYSGRKIELRKNDFLILALHAAFSVLAIAFTLFLAHAIEHIKNTPFITTTFLFWILSLSFGLFFYYRKYHKTDVLEENTQS